MFVYIPFGFCTNMKYILLILLNIALSQSLSSKLVKSFFDLKNINAVYIKTCSIQDDVQLFKLSLNGQNSLSSLDNLKQLKNIFYRVGIFIDLSCINNVNYVFNDELQNKINPTFTWLIKLKSSQDLKIISKLNLRIDNDLTVMWDNNLYDVYRKIMGTSNIEISHGYTWSEMKGLDKKLTKRIFNLDKIEMFGGIYFVDNIYNPDNFSQQMQDKSFKGNLDTANRYYYILNLHMSDLYNYTIKLKQTIGWGIRDKNGQFNNGMIGQLIRGETNLTVGPLQILADRNTVADKTVSVFSFEFFFVFKQPRTIGSYTALAHQLSTTTWICVGILCLSSAITFYICEYSKLDNSWSFSNCILLVIGALSAQGAPSPPVHTSGRIVCIFTLLMGFMVSTYYNAATLNALLSASPLSIKTINDLLKSNYKLVFMDQPYFTHKPTLERTAAKEIIAKVNENKIGPLNIKDGLSLIFKGPYGYCGERTLLLRGVNTLLSDQQKCDLSVLKASPLFWGNNYLQKNSPYREMIARGYARMVEHGLTNRQKLTWFSKKPTCIANQPYVSVRLEPVTIAIGIVCSGGVIAILIFSFEYLFKRFKMYNLKKHMNY